jgi:hypothetical protein
MQFNLFYFKYSSNSYAVIIHHPPQVQEIPQLQVIPPPEAQL